MRSSLRIFLFLGLGLLLGGALGLYVGWYAWPTEFTDADLTLLADGYRRDYALMIAQAYAQDGDLNRARQRLRQLEGSTAESWYLEVTVDAILAGQDEAALRYLVALADDLGLASPLFTPFLPETAGGP